MKNVAIIIQKLNGGGAERTASNLSISLKDHYNVHLIVFDGRDISYPYAGMLHDLKIPVAKGTLSKFVNMYKRIYAVKRILKQEKIDCAISLMEGANLVNIWARGEHKVITSIRQHMSKLPGYHEGNENKLKMRAMAITAKESDCVVALSKGVEKDLHDNFGYAMEKMVTIYNPCDYEKLREMTAKKQKVLVLEKGNALVTMGRLNRQKGQWHLIRALSLVKEQIPDVKLYIFGEGELRQPLEKLIADLQMEENVKLMGYVEAPHAYLEDCDCFVFPSIQEGLGNVLLEAMAFGMPCIAADCPSGPREILAPGTDMQEKLDAVEYAEFGVLTSVCSGENFNAEDPLTKEEKQLAEAIIAMLADEKLRKSYAEKSRQRILDFSPEKIAQDWIKVIES